MSNRQRVVDLGMAAAAEKLLPGTVSDTLRTRMRQLPQRLRGSGLAATYAFLLSKRGDGDDVARAYGALATAIPRHLADQGLLGKEPRPENFLNVIANLDLAQYARITAEVDALAVWLSRLAEALHEKSGRAGEGGGNADAA